MLFALRRETTQLLTLVQTVQLYPVKLCKHLLVLKRKKKVNSRSAFWLVLEISVLSRSPQQQTVGLHDQLKHYQNYNKAKRNIQIAIFLNKGNVSQFNID